MSLSEESLWLCWSGINTRMLIFLSLPSLIYATNTHTPLRSQQHRFEVWLIHLSFFPQALRSPVNPSLQHRDLHWGNVLLRPLNSEEDSGRVEIALGNGRTAVVPTHGVRACVIDYTLSRMEKKVEGKF